MSESAFYTSRLRLSLLDGRPAHAELYRALYTCPRVMASVMQALDDAEADAAFVRTIRHNDLDTPGHRFWAIEDRASLELLGLAALQRRNARGEFGVMVRADHWNRRIANEALGAVLVHAFERAALEWVDVHRADDGHAPIVHRLVAPFGFERVTSPGIASGQCHWVLSREQWRQARPCRLD